ncbi:MAG: Hsp20/alpha crystallin family protein [Methanoregula sp.]|jgi:HSP20 family molecular chaperone IbpA|uniref:Hsp20/alpha crystallin family protein n=1 Tax=Methanoregula sp. TaxID=2052170 RepID=UPI003C22D9DB
MKRDELKDSTVFDPPIRITDEGRHIRVGIDLPGVAEEQIRIDLEKTTFTISISEDQKTITKAIQVPRGARFFKKKFSDGVLEIVLEKPAS